MFVHTLSPPQRRLLFLAVLALIQVDESIHEQEAEVREALEREIGLPDLPTEPIAWDSLRAGLSEVGAGAAGKVILLELAGVALVDKELHPQELEALTDLSRAMGISAAQLADFLNFAARSHELTDEARLMVFS